MRIWVFFILKNHRLFDFVVQQWLNFQMKLYGLWITVYKVIERYWTLDSVVDIQWSNFYSKYFFSKTGNLVDRKLSFRFKNCWTNLWITELLFWKTNAEFSLMCFTNQNILTQKTIKNRINWLVNSWKFVFR